MKYTSQNKQLTFDLFRSSFDELDKTNRWVMLGDLLPWAEIEKRYNSKLNNKDKGAGNKPARLIISALIIKHKLNLGDEETVQMIQENPYMQYMCGLPEYTTRPVFDPSLFVTIRKRISEEELNDMTVSLLKEQQRLQQEKARQESQADKDDKDSKGGETPSSESVNPDAQEFTDSKGRLHKGVLKIDATCANAEVRYPVDVDIVNDGLRILEEYTTEICNEFGIRKPKTPYKSARAIYLELVKRKKKAGKFLKETLGMMLAYLEKQVRILFDIIVSDKEINSFFTPTKKRILGAVCTMLNQQKVMFANGTHQCADRIVSIFQPHVRPIVRGKAKANTEFGAKIGASIVEGYTFIDHHSWDAYNESSDLSLQIQLFKERFGYLPATVLADKIYMNRQNRDTLLDLEVRTYCKPLGRPPKDPPSAETKARMAKAVGERNEIECSFGTGKRIYRADNIRAKLPDTARCWTGMCYFVKNVMKFLRELCHALYEIWHTLRLITSLVGIIRNPLVTANY